MGKANAAMAAMGATNDPKKVAAAMQQFQRENAKMEMGQEMMDDTLDGVFDDDEVEGETDDLMNQASLASLTLSSTLSALNIQWRACPVGAYRLHFILVIGLITPEIEACISTSLVKAGTM